MPESNANVGILGYGEIGKAIAQFYENPKIKDLERDDDLKGVEILHVCIPWSDRFGGIVKENIEAIGPKLIIIHSTVVVGATKELIESLSNGIESMVVHSPVRGVHPNLYEGMKTFVKYIGADKEEAGRLAEKHFKELGIRTKVVNSSSTTEALKLWDTTQYGWMIVLNKAIKEWCDEHGVDFDVVYGDANKTYNEGFQELGRSEVVRPYLKYMPGAIGGHCVVPNCQLLESEITEFIVKKNKFYEQQK